MPARAAGLSPRTIAAGAGWRGDARAFADALVQAGWLDGDGTIHDWQEYAGRLIERRRQDAERKRNATNPPADVRRNSTGVPAEIRRNRTGPNLTGPDRREGSPPTGENFPAAVNARDGGADAPTVTTAAATKAQGPKVGYLALSGAARFVVDDWREQQGRKRPPKLNPAQCAEIELAVAELGTQRLIEANAWAARNAVPEIVKAIRAARTKRQRDEDEAADQERAQPPTVADGGVAGESLAPPTDEEQAVWQAAREALTAEMSRPNWETYIAPLTLAGRGADGGLRLRAPPMAVASCRRFGRPIARALFDAGDPGAQRVVIVAARAAGQE